MEESEVSKGAWSAEYRQGFDRGVVADGSFNYDAASVEAKRGFEDGVIAHGRMRGSSDAEWHLARAVGVRGEEVDTSHWSVNARLGYREGMDAWALNRHNEGREHSEQELKLRFQARIQQRGVELERLQYHNSVMLKLCDSRLATPMLALAARRVNDWQLKGQCWHGYILRWREILAMPLQEMDSAVMQVDGDGPALRQNSPFFGDAK